MSDEPLTDLIRAHLGRYQEARLMDVYKLLHQATFGPGHLVANKKTAREYLEMELGQISPSAGPLTESIHPDGALVRLHLCPYLGHTDQAKPLLEAFIRSAEQVSGDPASMAAPMAALMAARWASFVAMVESDRVLAARFSLDELRLFGTARAREGWSALSHSPEFTAVYHPHYRVLTAGEAAALCKRLKISG